VKDSRRRLLATGLIASLIISAGLAYGLIYLLSSLGDAGLERQLDADSRPPASLGSVPTFDLPDLQTDSIRYNLGAFAGKPLVINVFDYTCVPCIRELPMISATARSNPEVAFLGVHLMLQRDDAQNFVRKLKLSFPVAYDAEGTFATSVLALPTTIFFDRSGREVARVTGPISKDDLADRLQRLR
jgi:thiol-disulfide isomerase/thioredoxin